jgi:hypothetical protein
MEGGRTIAANDRATTEGASGGQCARNGRADPSPSSGRAGWGRCPITCSPHPTRARIPAQSSLRRLRKLVCDASHPPPLRVGGISACAARLVSIIVAIVIQACSIAAGIFSGARAPHSGPPEKPRGVKRREAPVRNAAPLARLADGPVPCGTADPSRGPARLSALHRGDFVRSLWLPH